MSSTVRAVRTFPSTRIPSHSGGLPVEVVLVAQLGSGGGDHLIEHAAARQRGHETFVDALDEPSARLGAMDLGNGDATSLYSFVVGAGGHPFHRHAGHRVFTAISGSAGAQLRFSTAPDAQVADDPHAFVAALHHVDIPADCLFTVRFGGGTWHQFVPLRPRSAHPALFALSCHTNELGGDLAPELRQRVLANDASIPALTEVLPAPVRALLESAAFDTTRVATTALSLEAPPMSWLGRASGALRRVLGRIRARIARLRRPVGFLADNGAGSHRAASAAVAEDSLLRGQLARLPVHEDAVEWVTGAAAFASPSATAALAAILAGFLENRPLGVSRLMRLRNRLVRPLGLRTSPLGCPVSSLLSTEPSAPLFEGRFPVLAQRIDAADAFAEVILGADDAHLVFRSCVGVERLPDGRMRCTLGTRVHTLNRFGRFYMAMIGPVHRHYIAPTLLRQAVDHATKPQRQPGEAIDSRKRPVRSGQDC